MGQTTQTAWNAGLQTGTAALRAAHVLTPTVLKAPAAPSATKTPYH